MTLTRTLAVSDDFPDLDSALAFAVQTLDQTHLSEVHIEISWFSRLISSNGLGADEWADRWQVSVSGVAT